MCFSDPWADVSTYSEEVEEKSSALLLLMLVYLDGEVCMPF
jgi:hypothetical protein